MGWFGEKKKKENLKISSSLPEMPKLPELPKIGDDSNRLPRLPSYPPNSLGEKFSQTAIKEAVSGGKESDREVFNVDDSFPENEESMMQKPPVYPIKELSPEKMRNLQGMNTQNFIKTRTKESEPVFVRIDKFEESLEIFEKAKRKITEIERFISEVKRIREKEESELQGWENEMQIIKRQFEKIDRDLFSKL